MEEAGKRGLRVSPLDVESMHHHYEVRGPCSKWARRPATWPSVLLPASWSQVTSKSGSAAFLPQEGRPWIVVTCPPWCGQDEAFHQLFYAVSGNPLLAQTAEPHWRYLRRVMGDVLRHAEPPHDIWYQHETIAQAVLAGDADRAGELMTGHATRAAKLLASNFSAQDPGQP